MTFPQIPPHCRAAAPTSLIRTLKCTSLLRARLVHVRARQDGYSFNPVRLQFLSCFPSSLLVLSLTFPQTCPSPASRQRAASSVLKHFLESGIEERHTAFITVRPDTSPPPVELINTYLHNGHQKPPFPAGKLRQRPSSP